MTIEEKVAANRAVDLMLAIMVFLRDMPKALADYQKANEAFEKAMTEAKALPKAKRCDRGCYFWSYDMDGAFCCHPKSFEIAPPFMASTNRMSTEGHCQSGWDDPAKNTLALWKGR